MAATVGFLTVLAVDSAKHAGPEFLCSDRRADGRAIDRRGLTKDLKWLTDLS